MVVVPEKPTVTTEKPLTETIKRDKVVPKAETKEKQTMTTTEKSTPEREKKSHGRNRCNQDSSERNG